MEDLHKIAKHIKNLREYRGLSQKELADKVGLFQPDISEIEKGERNISINTLVKIGTALNCSIDINLTPIT